MLRRKSTTHKEEQDKAHNNDKGLRRKTTRYQERKKHQSTLRRKTTMDKNPQPQNDISLPRTFERNKTYKINISDKEQVRAANSFRQSTQLPPLQINVKNGDSITAKQRRTSSLILNPKLLFSRKKVSSKRLCNILDHLKLQFISR